MERTALSLSRLVHIDWVIFERQKNGNHGHVGEGSFRSRVRVFIFGKGDGGRCLEDRLQGSGLVVELTSQKYHGHLMLSGGPQTGLSFWDVPQGKVKVSFPFLSVGNAVHDTVVTSFYNMILAS